MKSKQSLRFERGDYVWFVDYPSRNIEKRRICDAFIGSGTGPFHVYYTIEGPYKNERVDEDKLFELNEEEKARQLLLSWLETDLGLADEKIKTAEQLYAQIHNKISYVSSDTFFNDRR